MKKEKEQKMTEQIKQLYKYTDPEGIIKILENRTFRFSTRGQLNDTEDLMQSVHFTQGFYKHFNDVMIRKLQNAIKQPEIKLFKHEDSKDFCEFIYNFRYLFSKNGSKESKGKLISRLHNIMKTMPFREAYKNLNQGIIESVNDLQSKTRIFCTTDRNDYIDMWKEYASRGRGAVLALNLSQTNFPFLNPTKVTYSDEKISLFQTDYIIEYFLGLIDPEDKKTRIMEETYRCLSTKKISWSKENEYRFFIHCGEKTKFDEFELQPFSPDVISEIYLGYNMETDIKEKIMELLKSFDKIKIFQTEVSPIDNKLNFLPIN